MSKTIKQFDYQVSKMATGESIPSDPHVVIVLDHWMSNDDGLPIISPNLMSDGEIDDHVQHLKADLDALARRAKVALSRARDETKAITSKTNSN